ncbi:MAG: hypothetical protein ACYCPT_01325, partial [Acidimicrobiales bacterium]
MTATRNFTHLSQRVLCALAVSALVLFGVASSAGAVTALATPSATVVSATSVNVSFTTDTSTTDSYTVSIFSQSSGTLTNTCVVTTPPASTLESCDVTGLTSAVTYSFIVTPSTGTYAAPSPASNAVTPGGPLATPSATVASTTSAEVTFNADAAWTYVAGNIYTVAASGTGGQACTVGEPNPASSASLSCTVPSLVSGTSYTFTVSETGATPTSSASLPSNAVTPGGPLATPSAQAASTTSAKVSFSADSAWVAGTGDAYTVTSSPGGFTCSVANATTTLAGSQSCVV